MSAAAPASLPAAGGVLLLDKPSGPTSHDVVAGVRRTLGERRVGHTGTLDPLASGLLVLCLGPATRLSQYLTGLDKEYLARLRLGQRTTTDDVEGPVTEERDWRALEWQRVEEALGDFRGRILQVPPRFSAKKVAGVAAHRRARRGEEIVLEAVPVTVHELELCSLALPFAELRLRCSSGTYVRALARDLGEKLGVGAHLTALRRTRVGGLRVEDAAPPQAIDDPDALRRALLEPAAAMAHLPQLALGAEDAQRLARGQSVALGSAPLAQHAAALALHEGALVAVVVREGERLQPRKVLQGAGS